MIIIGIDPGQNGGIVVLNGKNLLLKKMPETPKEIFDFLKKFTNTDCVAYMEKLHGMPRMGGVSMFKFGMNNGFLKMALIAAGITTEYISPQVWQKEFKLGTKAQCKSGTEWKNKLKCQAEYLFPKEKIHLWSADAVLIAEYGRRYHKN